MTTHGLYFLAGVVLTSLYFRARIRALTRRLKQGSNALEEAINKKKRR